MVLILAGHLLAAWPAFRNLRHGVIPSTLEFVLLSFLLYYDIGLIADIAGINYDLRPFPALSDVDFDVWGIVAAFLLAAPWLLRLGALLGSAKPASNPPRCSLKPRLKIVFYVATILICLACVVGGISYLLRSATIWSARLLITEAFGPLIILLYVPLHLLAFYCRQTDSHSKKGLGFGIFLAAATIVATLAIGQRTNLLLPFLIMLVFRKRPKLQRAAIGAAVLFWAATLMLPSFKSYDLYGSKSVGELAVTGVAGDLVRAPVLAEVIVRSDLAGTHMMPFPLAGYWYSLEFFVPRDIAFAKGQSTASYVTGAIAGSSPDDLTWGFGFGFLEELAANAGLIMVPLGVILYGVAIAKLDRLSYKFPAIVPAARLSALWMCGYHLPALLMSFGVMAGVGLVCTALFSDTECRMPLCIDTAPAQ